MSTRPARTLAAESITEAIGDVLDGSITDLDGAAVPVVNGIPRTNGKPDIEEPFVSIDVAPSTDHSSNTTTGEDRTVRVSAHSTYNGSKEVNHLASQVANLLDQTQLDLGSGLNNYHTTFDRDTPFDHDDPKRGVKVRRVVCEFTVLTQVTS